jgi:hypothetical protein
MSPGSQMGHTTSASNPERRSCAVDSRLSASVNVNGVERDTVQRHALFSSTRGKSLVEQLIGMRWGCVIAARDSVVSSDLDSYNNITDHIVLQLYHHSVMIRFRMDCSLKLNNLRNVVGWVVQTASFRANVSSRFNIEQPQQ